MPRSPDRSPEAGPPIGGEADPALRQARALLRALDLPADDVRPFDAPAPSAAAEWARSGAMALTGEADGPPRFARGPLASAARGAVLALASLAPGRGFETLDGPALLGERAALFGLARRGAVSCGGAARLLPVADGILVVQLPRADDWRLVAAWLELDRDGRALERTRDWSAVARALAARAGAPLCERGRAIGLAVAPVVDRPAVPASPFRLAHASRTAAGPPGRRPPRVLDLSTLWAGPLAGGLLAQAGWEVLKVESRARPDGARSGERRFFDLLNADKHPCALDLTDPAERDTFERLLEGADVVLESARPRALAQLGVHAEEWVRGRAGRLWVSLTGYGRDHDWIAFGDDAAVAAGLAYGPAEGRPAGSGADGTACFCADAIADPLTGLAAAVAAAGLMRAGRGGLLSLALVDVAAHAAFADGPRAGDRLTLPVARRDGGWCFDDGSGWQPIAPPRARAPRGPAPPLEPPDPERVARWSRAC